MSLLWTLLIGALAKPPEPNQADDLQNEWRSLQYLRADPTRYRLVTEPFTVQDGPLEVRIDAGLLVPVFSGHSAHDRRAASRIKIDIWADDGVRTDPSDRGSVAFVGFVWVAGEGQATLSWTERADHLAFANHLVRDLGEPREDFAGVARGEPWTADVHEGLFLSIDPTLQDLFLGPDDESDDPLEVVVYAEKSRPGALTRAKALLENRSSLLESAGVDAGLWIAQDRLAVARGRRATPAHTVIDLHTDTPLGQIHRARSDQPTGVDWFALIRDETGVTDPRCQSAAWALDPKASWRLTCVPFPPEDPEDPLSPPTAPVRLVAEDAYVMVLAADRAAEIGVEIKARLQLRAVGGTIDHFDLHVPRAGNRSAFEILSATRDDGLSMLAEHPLIAHDPVLDPTGVKPDDDGDDDGKVAQAPDADPTGDPLDPDRDRDKPKKIDPYHDRPESRVTLVPPEPLEPGEKIVLDISWRDRWPLVGYELHDVAGPGGAGTMVVATGVGSGRQDVLPRLPGTPQGNPSKFRVRIYAQKRRYLASAASGTHLSTTEDEYFNITESGQIYRRVPFVSVAVGPFQIFDQGAPGMPNLRTRMYSKEDGAEIASEVRRMVDYYQGFLPPYPWPEHEVVQVPGTLNGWVWVAAHEMTALMQARATSMMAGAQLTRQGGGNLAQLVLAHEIAHQWWGHNVQPAHRDDFWMAETFAEAQAQMYFGAVRGQYEEKMADKRDEWERWDGGVHPPRASLTSAYHYGTQPDVVYRYGPYVFMEMLRPRIGQVAYHGALDLLQRDFAYSRITTERIQDYFEKASEQDLDDFFDFWVHGGMIPEQVELVWQYRDGRVTGRVESDVPFGTFDVPVVVDGQEVRVFVVDGVGELELEVPGRPTEVALDPAFRILAVKRIVREASPG